MKRDTFGIKGIEAFTGGTIRSNERQNCSPCTKEEPSDTTCS